MLVWIDELRKIAAWNESISEDEAQKYLSKNCIWVESLAINPPSVAENQIAVSYLQEDISVRYEIADVVAELTEQEKTMLETAVNVDYLVCLADMGL